MESAESDSGRGSGTRECPVCGDGYLWSDPMPANPTGEFPGGIAYVHDAEATEDGRRITEACIDRDDGRTHHRLEDGLESEYPDINQSMEQNETADDAENSDANDPITPRDRALNHLMTVHADQVDRRSPYDRDPDPDPVRYFRDVVTDRDSMVSREAMAFHRVGKYLARGKRPLPSPDDVLTAIHRGPYTADGAEEISKLALRFPSPNDVIVVSVGMLEPEQKWMAHPSSVPRGTHGPEPPDGPTELPRRILTRYFYEYRDWDLITLADSKLDPDDFRREDISDRTEDHPLYHGMTRCDGCGENLIPFNDKRMIGGLWLCDDCINRRINGEDLPMDPYYGGDQDGGSSE